MKSLIALFALALTLGAAGSAAAQSNQHVAYQNALLARSLSSADKAFCDGKAGNDAAARDACHVTRLFVSDIGANQDSGFPPMTDIKYASKAETGQILDRMTKYGG
jgi:hypothetical protein